MIIKTVNTGNTYEIEDFKGVENEHYVFSLNGRTWYYGTQWKSGLLILLNPTMIRKSIKREIITVKKVGSSI